MRKRNMTKKMCVALLTFVLAAAMACAPASARRRRRGAEGQTEQETETGPAESPMDTVNAQLVPQEDGAVCRTTYEVFVRSFCDSDGDGIGDLAGLLQKLDYICDGDPKTASDLGCDGLWLMPVFSSPTYHKYDVTDYYSIDPEYGSMEDFEALLAACHDRGMRVILDLPLNHTSVLHPWFAEAAAYLRGLGSGQEPSAEECPYVEYYNFSREPQEGYAPLEESGWYYEARFWEGMPDLDLDRGSVRTQIRKIVQYWLNLGVDGFRLDAVTSFYTGDHAKNIAFLTWLNRAVKARRPDAYLVAEAWENQEVYARYYGSGIDSMFDFAFSGAEGIIARTASGKKSAAAYAQELEAEEALYASYGNNFINAPFYTNHDMARSAGYYAADDGSRAKFAGALNLLMTGNCFVYYGEELGMKGSGKDENKRAPMYWTDAAAGTEDADTGTEGVTGEADGAEESVTSWTGMCEGPPGMDAIEMKYGSLAAQEEDPLSIYRYYRHAIRVRAAFPAIADGKTRIVQEMTGDNVCAFFREAQDEETVLIVINTSEEAQTAELSAAGTDPALRAVLTVSRKAPELEGSTLTLPPYGIAVLTVNGENAA